VFGIGTRVGLASMTEPAVIAPVGELDLHAAGVLAPQLDEAVGADYPQVILDLSAVTLVDSTALGAIIQAAHRFRAQGRTLSVVAPNGSAAAVLLELLGLRRSFSVFPSREAALA
jgi:anti-sigma B factor antagonist